ncbi:uncharacterized protein TNCV_1441551 [Trichonephila clavipes]|uniref:Mutator-like transposase domain-containing protein n=1 Tax=Trichonephila clavipes TaxID=2585209 RepID=A0A8X6UXF7_TRICX|nr:uncharacterized protein TNCV_1441551 [Trichonephila clavipes]
MSRQKPTTYVSVISQALHQKWKLWGLPEYFFDLKKNADCNTLNIISKAFMSVKDTYGLNSVTKFECIGRIQKRVGSRLRKLKTKTKGLSGKGKLTDNFIHRLQNYYGTAVRSNVGNLNAMQQNVIAALYHCASSDKKPMHGQCPIGKESCCYFQRGVANGTNCSTKYAGLSNDVLNKIKPVYLELCDKQILSACMDARKMPTSVLMG